MKESKKKGHKPGLSVPQVDLGQLEQLLTFMSDHGLEEFEYAHGDLHIRLKKAATAPSATPNCVPPAAPEAIRFGGTQPAKPAAEPAEAPHVIKSPIVGTYYSGPNPEAPPFVRVGDIVEAGQTVCIIEAMKLMNEIEADISGQVARTLVENGQPVEYGAPLFELRPAGQNKKN